MPAFPSSDPRRSCRSARSLVGRIGGALAASVALAATLAPGLAWAQPRTPAAPPGTAPGPSGERSGLDAALFYQLLVGELELAGGQPGNAYAVLLDAARRTRDEALFRRTVDVALQARAGDQALAAARAWRQALPQSTEAMRYEVQLLAALNRSAEAAEPLRQLLARTPDAERAALAATLPRLFQRAPDQRAVGQMQEDVLLPYTAEGPSPATRAAAHAAIGRAWWQAQDGARALAYAERAQAVDPSATAPVALALELLASVPDAQKVVAAFLQRPDAAVAVRLAYVRALSAGQRYVEAIAQLEQVTRSNPDLAGPWLTLGALHLELRHPREADAALQRFLALQAQAPAGAAAARSADEDDADDGRGNDGGRTQALLMLSQAADLRGDAKAAGGWLDKIDNPQRALEVQTRRALLLARQGKLREARQLVQQVPERRAEDARGKLLAESQVLREVKRWSDAYGVLATANQRFPNDADLLYEQAMVAEKLDRLGDMEQLLRRVMAIKPEHQHAYNALGYSLADRNLRLPEARQLIQKALELAPGDPFITDSLGWVEFRLGNRDEALRLLRKAYAARPDPEIAAHLGEVLWATGARDEARRVWREGRERDAVNEVLRETLSRLQVTL